MRADDGIFKRCGLARLSDLQTDQWKAEFAILKEDQQLFLREDPKFRSREYPWPRDALNTWSRVWEYPYVAYQLREWRRTVAADRPRVIDLGSGVTFFPFTVAKMDVDVTCVDVDARCGPDITRAAQIIPHAPGKVDFVATAGSRLPFADASVDCVYCVSVLEHVPAPTQLIDEVARILRPNGRLVLTLDLDLRGGASLGVPEYEHLRRTVFAKFDPAFAETSVHPLDELHSDRGPYAVCAPEGLALRKLQIREAMRWAVGRRPVNHRIAPYHLAIAAFTLVRV